MLANFIESVLDIVSLSCQTYIIKIPETEAWDFANDTIIYSSSLNYKEVNQKSYNNTNIILNLFRINSILINLRKSW